MIVGFGENSVDIVYRLPGYPQPGTALSKVAIEQRDVRPGGQVATTLATCAALGLRTRYVGAVGDDEHGRWIREELRRRGVDVSDVIEREAPNRYAVILVDASHGERAVLWKRDARLAVAREDVRPGWLAGATFVHVDATDPEAAVALAQLAREAGLEVSCDIDQITPETTTLLNACTIPIVAEHVPAALTGEDNIERAFRVMRRTHRGRLVVTLGARGAAMLDGERYIHAPGFPVTVVDSTGAGDVFRGAFISALLRGVDADTVLRFANAAAAVSCTKDGAMSGVPSVAEVHALLAASA